MVLQIFVQKLLCGYVFNSLGNNPEGTAGSYGDSLCGPVQLLSRGTASFYAPISNGWGFQLLSKYHIIYRNKTLEWDLNFLVVLFLKLYPTKTVQSIVFLSHVHFPLCGMSSNLVFVWLQWFPFYLTEFFEYKKHFHGSKVKAI